MPGKGMEGATVSSIFHPMFTFHEVPSPVRPWFNFGIRRAELGYCATVREIICRDLDSYVSDLQNDAASSLVWKLQVMIFFGVGTESRLLVRYPVVNKLLVVRDEDDGRLALVDSGEPTEEAGRGPEPWRDEL